MDLIDLSDVAPVAHRTAIKASIPTLRDYQETAIRALFAHYATSRDHALVTMPTGTGKSLVIAWTIRATLEGWPGVVAALPHCRFLVLTHSKELVENDAAAFARVMPGFDYGIYCADLGRKDLGKQVTFASVQSVARNIAKFRAAGKIHCIIVDEAHMVNPQEGTNYTKVLGALTEDNPTLGLIGLTATAWRLKGGPLISQGIFTTCAVDMCSPEWFLWFIEQGYLIKPVPYKPRNEFDASKVKVKAGDFEDGALEAEMERQQIIPRALAEAVEYGQAEGRRKWLAFAPSIKQCEAIKAWLIAHGITADCVHNEVTKAERRDRLKAHKEGRIKCLVNQNILTTGYDDPAIDFIIMLRPTISAGLWVQMLGRGTRPYYAPGYDLSTQAGRLLAIKASPKHNCRVMDFAGNTRRLGPINDPIIPDPKRRKKATTDEPMPAGPGDPVVCDVCGAWNPPRSRECQECGATFADISAKADNVELVREQKAKKPEPTYLVVQRMHASYIPATPNGPALIRVTYVCHGSHAVRQIIDPNAHGKYAYVVEKWWREHRQTYHPVIIPPAEELAQYLGDLKRPDRLKVEPTDNAKWPWKVKSYEFAPTLTP